MPANAAYFHAQFRRAHRPAEPLRDPRRGPGPGPLRRHFLAWTQRSKGWFGEGEIKFYHRRRQGVPHDLRHGDRGLLLRQLRVPSAVFDAVCQRTLGHDPACQRERRPPSFWSLYRWHIMDPICFEQDLRVTIQALGWEGSKIQEALGRHRVGRILVSDRSARGVSPAAAPGGAHAGCKQKIKGSISMRRICLLMLGQLKMLRRAVVLLVWAHLSPVGVHAGDLGFSDPANVPPCRPGRWGRRTARRTSMRCPASRSRRRGSGQCRSFWWLGDPLTKERLGWKLEQMAGMGVVGLPDQLRPLRQGRPQLRPDLSQRAAAVLGGRGGS